VTKVVSMKVIVQFPHQIFTNENCFVYTAHVDAYSLLWYHIFIHSFHNIFLQQ